MRIRGIVLVAYMLLTVACVNPSKLPVVSSVAKSEEARLTKETDEAIKNSPVLQEVDGLCTQQLPSTLKFVKVNRHMDFRRRSELVYGYHSEESFATVKREYKNRLLPLGWNVALEEDNRWGDSRIIFANDTFEIRIYHVGSGDGVNYKIHCEKLSPQKS